VPDCDRERRALVEPRLISRSSLLGSRLQCHEVTGDHAVFVSLPLDIGTKGVAGDNASSCGFDVAATILGHLPPPPLLDCLVLNTEPSREGSDSSDAVDCLVECGHGGR
jgi:hypothetical protein